MRSAFSLCAVTARASRYADLNGRPPRPTWFHPDAPDKGPTGFLAAAEGQETPFRQVRYLSRTVFDRMHSARVFQYHVVYVSVDIDWETRPADKKYGVVPVSSKRKSAREELGISRVARFCFKRPNYIQFRASTLLYPPSAIPFNPSYSQIFSTS